MFPNFLVIGGQKCGTSWLQDNLESHPQVWLPPTKEVHYFDRGNIGLLKRLFSTTKRMKKARTHVAAQLRSWMSGSGDSDLKWALNYWLARRDDEWYRKLFPEIAGRITGEICPGYARMRGAEVARVKQLMPDTRIVYLLRNPIERSWSYATQYFTSPRAKGRYGSTSNVPAAVLRKFLERDTHGHSDYLGALNAWQPHYPPDRMLIGFFDELESDPQTLYVRILRFLEIDASPAVIPSGLSENRHQSRGSKVDMQYRSFLANLHLESLASLHDRLRTDVTKKWLNEARQLAAAWADS